jgi:hypothetical protein
MVLSLGNPVGSNFLKDFPAQNETNLNAIDDYAGPCLVTDALGTYIPNITSSGTQPVLGTGGASVGYYYQIFDQIWTWGQFRFGTSGTTFGTGSYFVSLPFEVNSLVAISSTLGASPTIGNGYLWDASGGAGVFPVSVHLNDSNNMVFGIKNDSAAGSRAVTSTNLITFANSDGISWSASYQRLA